MHLYELADISHISETIKDNMYKLLGPNSAPYGWKHSSDVSEIGNVHFSNANSCDKIMSMQTTNFNPPPLFPQNKMAFEVKYRIVCGNFWTENKSF